MKYMLSRFVPFALACGWCVNIYAAPSAETATWLLTPVAKLNKGLPNWLQFGVEERMRAEGQLGIGFEPDSTDRYLLNRFRVGANVRPSTWLKFEFQTQDARAFWREETPNKSPYQNTWDLRLAYAEIGDVEKYHVAFRVGRQELAFGDERLVGVSNWTNVTRTFDGYRLALQKGRFRLDAFAASVVVLQDGSVGQHTPGNYLEGLYGQIRNVVPCSVIEPYFLWRRSPGQKMGTGALATADFGTTGFRWAGKLPLGFDYDSEIAMQKGSLSTDSVSAWASHLQLGYKPESMGGLNMRYIVEYNFASGDKNSKDRVHNTFDQLYASGHDKLDLADLIGWKNIQHIRTGPEFTLSRKWSSSFKYSDYWLANAADALYNSSGSVVARSTKGTAGRWVGQEFDATLVYSPSKISQLGAGFAYLAPGTFLKLTTDGHGYAFPYLFYSTRF
jgi:hypothetical protein